MNNFFYNRCLKYETFKYKYFKKVYDLYAKN